MGAFLPVMSRSLIYVSRTGLVMHQHQTIQMEMSPSEGAGVEQ